VEKILLKMARQLMAYDEASLTNLWEQYAEIVRRFEPSKRWEEAVLVLSMIQGMRFKNQLFNLHWSEGQSPDAPMPERPRIEAVPQPSDNKPKKVSKPRGKVLTFKQKDDEPAS